MDKERKNGACPCSSGGWGSKAVARIFSQEKVALKDSTVLLRAERTAGFMRVSCSWAKPGDPHLFEFCESGVKATARDTTAKRVTLDLVDIHPVSEL
jgi:hypothetical protein